MSWVFGYPTSSIEEGQEDDKEVEFDSWNFYKSRFTRILPVYYATYLYALPLIFLGHNDIISPYDYNGGIAGSVLAIFLQHQVFLKASPNGPSWTVSTLFFFYWFYPR